MTVGTETNLGVVPNFIKASSPDLLREAMLLNNLKLKSEIKYQDLQFANGYWYAWFYEQVDFWDKIKPKKAK
jgi:hypothetical protein